MGLIRRKFWDDNKKLTKEEQEQQDRDFEERYEKAWKQYKKTGVFSLNDPTGKSYQKMIDHIKEDPDCILSFHWAGIKFSDFIRDVRAGKYDI